MSRSRTTGWAAILMLLGAVSCEGRRESAAGAGMLSDSAPPGLADDSARPRPNEPAPFPEEATPTGGAAVGEMVEDTVARRAEPGAVEKPVPMPAEPRPGAGR